MKKVIMLSSLVCFVFALVPSGTFAGVDSNGAADLLWMWQGSSYTKVDRLEWNSGTSNFDYKETPLQNWYSYTTQDIANTDLDGNGKNDLFRMRWTSDHTKVERFEWNSSSSTYDYVGEVLDWYTYNHKGIDLADIDGNGKQDLLRLTLNNSRYQVYRWEWNNSTDSFDFVNGPAAGGSWLDWGGDQRRIALGDIDGDGNMDLLRLEYTSSRYKVYRWEWDGSGFAFVAGPLANDYWFDWGGDIRDIALGDIDNDGNEDLLRLEYNNGRYKADRWEWDPQAGDFAFVTDDLVNRSVGMVIDIADPVPEPATIALLGFGIVGFIARKK